MIAKLEWTLRNIQQNIQQLGVTINNESTTTESRPKKTDEGHFKLMREGLKHSLFYFLPYQSSLVDRC